MNVFNKIRHHLLLILKKMEESGALPAGLGYSRVVVEPPKDPDHGDMATNAAMVLAKPAGLNPRALADAIAEHLRQHPDVIAVEIAGPGFINIRFQTEFWLGQLPVILNTGTDYGSSQVGAGIGVNVEYVSANPTGPLHAAHARGAVVGDVLCKLLEKTGYTVTREYWLNDAGAQVDVLARSVYHRYREALGDDMGDIPAGCYPGDYVKPVGAALAAREGAKWQTADETAWLPVCRTFGIDAMVELIKADCAAMNIQHDVITSERGIIDSGKVAAAFDQLQNDGLIYYGILDAPKGKQPDDWEPREQHLFRATQFGDDVDRPLKKSDGTWTYFGSDIAYHLDKYERGSTVLINVFGADHGGYIKRLQAATTAITRGRATLDVKICQLVHLMENGVPVKISKRSGNLVLLSDVLERVGAGVVRLMMLTRRNDQTLEFDFAKVQEQSKDNPVFYIQYAHARICSVLRHAGEMFENKDCSDGALASADWGQLHESEDLPIVRLLATWPRVIEAAAEAHEPHRIAFYLQELAAAFHALWGRGREDANLRFVHDDNWPLTQARLALIRAVALVLASGLGVIGVEPAEAM